MAAKRILTTSIKKSSKTMAKIFYELKQNKNEESCYACYACCAVEQVYSLFSRRDARMYNVLAQRRRAAEFFAESLFRPAVSEPSETASGRFTPRSLPSYYSKPQRNCPKLFKVVFKKIRDTDCCERILCGKLCVSASLRENI